MKNLLAKLFGKKPEHFDVQEPVPATKEPPTLPINLENDQKSANQALDSSQLDTSLHYEVGYAQSIGKQRSQNEDSMFTFTSSLANHKDFLRFGLYIVADGMGGHKYGEYASGLAVKTLGQHILTQVLTPLLEQESASIEESVQEILQEGIQKAHQTITRLAKGGGTTLTAALLIDDQMMITHIGDSRCYTISPNGSIKLITRDHSLVMRMIELGQLTKEEAALHPQRNVLYRALGQNEPLTADIQTYPLQSGSQVLLCSDGLWGVVSEAEFNKIIYSSTSPQQACEKLVSAANLAGGPDNITAILVRIPTGFQPRIKLQ